MAKNIYITSSHRGRKTVWCAPISEMTDGIFGYTLECGHSWNSKIKRYPKSAAALEKALNASADECRRYNDYYYISTPSEVAAYDEAAKAGKIGEHSHSFTLSE